MSDRYNKKIPGQFFNVSAQGIYCGFLVPTNVMKKLKNLESAWMSKVRDVLAEHKDEIHISEWTGYFPKDKSGCETVNYVGEESQWYTKEERIELFKPQQPTAVDIYRCTREEAMQIAEEIWREKHPDVKEGEAK